MHINTEDSEGHPLVRRLFGCVGTILGTGLVWFGLLNLLVARAYREQKGHGMAYLAGTLALVFGAVWLARSLGALFRSRRPRT